jgi:hypothetical protein
VDTTTTASDAFPTDSVSGDPVVTAGTAGTAGEPTGNCRRRELFLSSPQ